MSNIITVRVFDHDGAFCEERAITLGIEAGFSCWLDKDGYVNCFDGHVNYDNKVGHLSGQLISRPDLIQGVSAAGVAKAAANVAKAAVTLADTLIKLDVSNPMFVLGPGGCQWRARAVLSDGAFKDENEAKQDYEAWSLIYKCSEEVECSEKQ